jgi:hypothetical protein
MATKKHAIDPNFRPEDSPIAWFGEMLIGLDRGDYRRVYQAQRELARLGWCVVPRPPLDLGNGA